LYVSVACCFVGLFCMGVEKGLFCMGVKKGLFCTGVSLLVFSVGLSTCRCKSVRWVSHHRVQSCCSRVAVVLQSCCSRVACLLRQSVARLTETTCNDIHLHVCCNMTTLSRKRHASCISYLDMHVWLHVTRRHIVADRCMWLHVVACGMLTYRGTKQMTSNDMSYDTCK